MKPELELFLKDRKTFVPPCGPLQCKICAVGEQPGRKEVFKRTPFVGPAGILFDGNLQDARIPRSEIYITNVIKDLDQPLNKYIIAPTKSGMPPTITPMGENYIEVLRDELSKCTANVFIAVGNVPLFALTSRWGITSWRGIPIESTLLPGRKVVPIIHPASYTDEKLWKNPSAYLNKHLIIMDLKTAKEQSEFPEIRREDRKIIIKPSFHETMEYLEKCHQLGHDNHIIDYDIEITNMELANISFAFSPNLAMSIPFTAPGGDYFPPNQEAEIMLKIAEMMKDQQMTKRGQFIIFDSHFLLRKYGIRTYNLHDTMIAQKILYPEFRVGLDFITSMWTDIPYYKKDGKFWLKGIGTFEQGWIYNGYDSISCADAHPKQMKTLEAQGNIATYNRQRALISPLTYMMERGIKVDVEGMKKEYDDYGTEIEILTEALHKVVGYPLNPDSPKQVANYFYIEKELPTYKKEGKTTTDEKALIRIARKGYPEAQLILDIRRAGKRRSTYLDPAKIDEDGRIRCAYNPVGTRYSRLSSAKNIFGTGGNQQNWPDDMLKYLIADEGYIFYSLDLSNFENRIVAYVGNIAEMISCFERGEDVHALTGALISGLPYEEVKQQNKDDIFVPIGDGKHTWRFWGKKCNHELNYDVGYKKFSLVLEIPEREGKVFYDKYHRAYPGVRGGFQAYVKAELAKNRTLINLMGRRVVFLGKWGDDLFRDAYSCIPQGTCGDVINERGINFIYYNQQWFKSIELLNQVHDSIGFQAPLSIPLIQHAEMLIKIKQNLETPLKWKDREFVIPADLTLGYNMSKASGQEIKGKEFSTNVETLAKTLKERIIRLDNK